MMRPGRSAALLQPAWQARRDRAQRRAVRRVARAQRHLGRKTERAFTRMQRRRLREQRQAARGTVWSQRDGAGDDPHARRHTVPEQARQARPTDPRPAWEQIASAWLGREVEVANRSPPPDQRHLTFVADLPQLLRA